MPARRLWRVLKNRTFLIETHRLRNRSIRCGASIAAYFRLVIPSVPGDIAMTASAIGFLQLFRQGEAVDATMTRWSSRGFYRCRQYPAAAGAVFVKTAGDGKRSSSFDYGADGYVRRRGENSPRSALWHFRPLPMSLRRIFSDGAELCSSEGARPSASLPGKRGRCDTQRVFGSLVMRAVLRCFGFCLRRVCVRVCRGEGARRHVPARMYTFSVQFEL